MLSRGDENLEVVRGWTGQDFFGGCWKSQEDRQLWTADDLHQSPKQVGYLKFWKVVYDVLQTHAPESRSIFLKKKTEDRKSTPTIPCYIDFQCYFLISSSFRGVDSGVLSTSQPVSRRQCAWVRKRGQSHSVGFKLLLHNLASGDLPHLGQWRQGGKSMFFPRDFTSELNKWGKHQGNKHWLSNSAHFILQGIK